jgi:hypothetical protein
VEFKGAGFLILEPFSALADSGAPIHRVRNVSFSQENNRTLHKFGEECGTRQSVSFDKEL